MIGGSQIAPGSATDNIALSPSEFVPQCRALYLQSFIRKCRHVLGLDNATLFTIGARAWSALAGVVTVLAITRFLTGAQQGYYFTISSLLALQIVFELGFSFVILQLASHETAHLNVTPDLVQGEPIAISRLASVLRKTFHYYGLVSAIMLATLIPGGMCFFTLNSRVNADTSWLVPWCIAAVLTSLNLFVTPFMSFLEGCGFVSGAAKARFWQALLGSLLAWTALTLHQGLLAPGLLIGGQAICALVWILRYRKVLASIWQRFNPAHVVCWRREIWSFQWRMAICWLCGYFAFQLFSPVLFAYQGAVVAGQMGLSLSVATALANTGLAWMNTKAAPFGVLVAKREFRELDETYFRALKQSTAVIIFGCFAIWLIVLTCSKNHLHFDERFLPLPSLALLLGTTALNHIVFCQAIYLRAHKKEVFLTLHIVSAVFVGASTYLLGKASGAGGVTFGYFVGRGVLCLILGTWTFEKKRREWHR